MADVIAFVFEFDALAIPELTRDHRNVAERITEDVVVGLREVLAHPIKFPIVVFGRQRVHGEVHASHVERSHFRRHTFCGRDTLGDGVD